MVKDVNGSEITVGCKVAFGADNGSTLYLGVVTNVTEKRVYITGLNPDGSLAELWNFRRYPERVAIIRG